MDILEQMRERAGIEQAQRLAAQVVELEHLKARKEAGGSDPERLADLQKQIEETKAEYDAVVATVPEPNLAAEVKLEVASEVEREVLRTKEHADLARRILEAAPKELRDKILDPDHPETIKDVDPDIVLKVVEEVRAERVQ